jgi:V/A-type H+-transporting ATPase subunit G/H
MELIKKIKESEKQAQEIIEEAKAEGAKNAEESRSRKVEILAEAEQERKKAIESAVSAAETEGLKEIKELKKQAEKDRQQLRDETSSKTADATEKVMDYLRG